MEISIKPVQIIQEQIDGLIAGIVALTPNVIAALFVLLHTMIVA